MSSSQKVLKSSENFFRLKPLVAGVRIVIASGFIASTGMPVLAELPIPVAGGGWVTSGSASQLINGNTLQINQHSDKAILNWQSFNVGKENTVNFVQPSASSVALNRIAQQDPSKILGQIKANGQVYLYNQNGFVFGKDSVVNTNTLLASTLKISDEAFNRGITRVFDEDGSAALAIEPMKAGGVMDPKTASILIEAGAKIHTDKTGRIIIAAPKIVNKGSLSSGEQGQIILAASEDKVYLQAADSKSPFAGLVVEVDTGGKVTNSGDVLAKQGNVTMAGFAVNQQGRITATTSVNVNGSIRLLAQEQHGKLGEQLIATSTNRAEAGADGLGKESKVTFTRGSVTRIIADTNGGSAIDEQKQPESYLQVTGNTVHLQSGSAIKVTGGNVNLTATDNLADPTLGHKGRIDVEKGALVDVSGTKGVVAAMERNVGEISVQSFELRDAPLQRNGILKGETIKVDLRKDTNIVDTSGAKARVSRGIAERLGKGGGINLTSSGDVLINEGANLDISGGSVKYQDGYINTTKLINDYGRIVDINAADPNEHYAGIYGLVKEAHKKWGVTTTWSMGGKGQFEPGYIEGKDAGAVNIKSPLLSWNGKLSAGATIGESQRSIDDAPTGGTFAVDMSPFQSLQNVVFQTEKNNLAIGLNDLFPLQPNKKPVDLVLSDALFKGTGVANVSVKTWGNATVSSGTSINMVPGGALSLEASSINIDGNINTAGGIINLSGATNITLPTAGQVSISKDAVLDVTGAWVNDFQLGVTANPTDLLAINGGKIKVVSEGNLDASAGSVMRADGGAWLNQRGDLTTGSGGLIDLAAVGVDGTPSMLKVNSQLSAFGLNKDGVLSLSSDKIIVGKVDGAVDDVSKALALSVSNGNFNLTPELGFETVNLNANTGDLKVKGDVALNLKSKNLQLRSDYRDKKTGSAIRDFTDIVLLPEHLRAPVNLNLAGTTGVVLEAGSSINVDKGSTVGLKVTAGSIFVDGAIQAAGGNINLNIDTATGLEYDSKQSIWLGENALLSVKGDTRLNPVNVRGENTGTVMDGGKVSIDGTRGYVIMQNGSLIDVSGTHAQLSINQAGPSGSNYNVVATDVASNAGTVSIRAAEGIVLDGTIQGFAGSSSTKGARLDLIMDRSFRKPPQPEAIPFPNGPLDFTIVQDAENKLDQSVQFDKVIPVEFNGQATVSADKIEKGGISDLRLITSSLNTTSNKVKFLGDVSLTTKERITIDAQGLEWVNGDADGLVELNTPYLKIGSSLNREVTDLPTAGAGKLTANTQWAELFGATRWDAFSDINLNSQHDLRAVGVRIDSDQRDFLGALVTAANLNLQASQLYPSTLSNFTFAIKNNSTGEINITGSNIDQTPLSAGGILNFNAPIINQSGVVKAPLGKINLTAEKELTLGEESITSVSAAGLMIPFGVTAGGLDWLYPLDSARNLVFNTPTEKQVVLNSPEVILQNGSHIDISGGGNLQAYEFQPGAGGSYDYLQPGSASYEGGFAIMPSAGTQLAAFDHYESAGWSYAPGSTVYLNGSDNLPAGQYTILPSHYALLPGAFLITPQANSQDSVVTTYTRDGLPIVSGYQMLAGTNIKDARTSAYRIETSEQVKIHSKYDIQNANNYYKNLALKNETSVPLLPEDSGQISIIAQTRLLLDGIIDVGAPGGRGARMDFVANNIKIVDSLSATPVSGELEILDADLSKLKVDSLFLGGSRKINASTGETDVTVEASNVTFDAGTQLTFTDLTAGAKEKVEVKAGASLEAAGTVYTGDNVFNITGDGALLRLSADKQIELNRTATLGSAGKLVVEAGSTLKASKSMLLDASQSTTLEGDILMKGGSLNLSANAINMGDVVGGTDNALNLSNQKLLNISVDELVLNSRGMVGLYGDLGQVDSNNNPVLGKDGLQAPISFDRLVINAAGISGFGNSDQVARLQAKSLMLANPLNVASAPAGSGKGRLDLLSTDFSQGAGSFYLNGFNKVNLNVKNEFTAEGKGILNMASDLNLTTGYLTTLGGSSFKVDASGHALSVNGNGSQLSAVTPGFGGAMEFIADSVAFDATALLPSGKLNLNALVGSVTLGSSAKIDLAGRAVKFADKVDYTPGGTFSAIADSGLVKLDLGSKIDLSSGGRSEAGGHLILKAPKQTVTLAGDIKAASGSAEFDVSTFGSTSFDKVVESFKNAGISDSIYIRSRDADIVQAANNIINANALTLVSDKGSVNISGQLHANGNAQGGKIAIYAGDQVTLESGSQVTATGVKGGKILLSSVDNDNDGIQGIELKSESLVDVSGATSSDGGMVTLRALRTDNDVNIKPIEGTVKGAVKFYAEGVKKYGNADLSIVGKIVAADINTIKNNTDAYMTTANMANVATRLGHGISLTPGVEIDYNGALTLNDKWDLVDWRYNGNAGDVVIRASEGLTLNQSLTDAFRDVSEITATDLNGVTTTAKFKVNDKLQAGNSWSYNLVAGADLSSADIHDAPHNNNLVIGAGSIVRTGSGDMSLVAGGDIIFTDGSSSVYNAGRPTELAPYGSLSSNFLRDFLYSEFPVAGGDLVLTAGGNITGTKGNSYFNDWLLRAGKTTINPIELNENAPTIWGVALGYLTSTGNPASSDHPLFQQNIGSFGAGNVSISAKGNISNLDVMMPTTGKQAGTKNTAPGALDFEYSTNQVQVNGGGNMEVRAGGDIAGGTYYVGKGTGFISADGSVTGGSQFTKGPQLLTGDTKFSVYAGKDVSLTGVSDPMILHNAEVNFFSYTDASALVVKSLTGNVNLGADATVISTMYNFIDQKYLAQIYPASLNVSAFGGDIVFKDQIVLFPSATANLNLLAEQNITSTIGIAFGMSDGDNSLLPNAYTPVASGDANLLLNRIFPFSSSQLNHAALPLHTGDKEPVRVVTRSGDIENISFNLAKKSIVKAGRDIKNLALAVQNIDTTDASILEAGRDVIYTSGRNPTTGGLLTNAAKAEYSGPGEVLVKAGRHVDLGASGGLSTVGNVFNANLANDGANLTVMAGANSQVDYAGFINTYLKEGDKYGEAFAKASQLITGFMRERLNQPLLNDVAAFEAFSKLNGEQYVAIEPQLSALVTPVLFNEIRISGSASAGTKALANETGYAAIETLFPGTNWKGDLSLFFSKIQTVDGGDINLLVPGGQVNAGLAVSFTGAKPASELGIVAQRIGNINAMVHDDFLVNTSRVFALDGGDIQIWSSDGDIDAGRGAKSAIAAPPPKISFDKNGNLVIEFPPIVSGSGIRTAASSSGVEPGDVFLFAPKGVVDAGEAGIGGKNVTISATAVLGANNIQVSGVGSGVPAASTGSVAAGLTGTSNMNANVNQVAQASTGLNDNDEENKKNLALGMLSVEVLGFGD